MIVSGNWNCRAEMEVEVEGEMIVPEEADGVAK
jgi:hypothetical protein